MPTSWRNIWKTTLFSIISLNIPHNLFFSTSPSKNTGTPSAFGCILGFLIYKLWHSQLPDNNIVFQERTVGYPLSIWWSVSVMYGYEWHNLQKVWDKWCYWLRMSVYRVYWTNPFPLHSIFLYIYDPIQQVCLHLQWPAHTLLHTCCNCAVRTQTCTSYLWYSVHKYSDINTVSENTAFTKTFTHTYNL